MGNIKMMSQSVGGAMEGEFYLTPANTEQRETIFMLPPNRVIPIIFLPGVMGSNLRMSRARTKEVKDENDIAWRPDTLGFTTLFGNVQHTATLTPAQRQLKLDPDTTEVDYYRYTEDAGKFDPSGTETKKSDVRHSNVSLMPSVGLLHNDAGTEEFYKSEPHPHAASAAQKARWRGWSEISFGDYELALLKLETHLNRMTDLTYAPYSHTPLTYPWRKGDLVDSPPETWGGLGGAPLEEKEVLRVSNCLYPVHAMGYNWLQSNEASAKKTAARIRNLIKTYQDHGHKCDKVILVTHSMGGILARALIHPEMGGIKDLVLGVYHSVQPAYGSGAAYKRVRSGVDAASLKDIPSAAIIGNCGQDVTAVFANAPGPLELLPTPEYGANWLRVEDSNGKILKRWPSGASETANQSSSTNKIQMDGSPTTDIYTQPNERWWRLINPDWINPAKKQIVDGRADKLVNLRIAKAKIFHEKIKNTFHVNTYASYSADPNRLTHGNVTYRIISISTHADDVATSITVGNESPEFWKLVSEDGEGDLIVLSEKNKRFKLRLRPPKESGDGTVPADYSAAKVKAKVRFMQKEYDHQGSYKADDVINAMLYAVIKIANTAEGWKN